LRDFWVSLSISTDSLVPSRPPAVGSDGKPSAWGGAAFGMTTTYGVDAICLLFSITDTLAAKNLARLFRQATLTA
jgi:hypothetical protein